MLINISFDSLYPENRDQRPPVFGT